MGEGNRIEDFEASMQRVLDAQSDKGLRDWFAGHILQGIVANTKQEDLDWEIISRYCFAGADVMLKKTTMKAEYVGKVKPTEKDGLIYSPPTWRVCSCDNGRYIKKVKSGTGSALDGAEYDLTIPCRIPIYYTPKQWQEAGGVLRRDTPCWIKANDGDDYWDLMEYASVLKNDIVIIATETGRPPEDWNG